MESYIIRIYRRDALDPEIVSGLAEGSSMEKPVPFSSLREVLDILKKSGQMGSERDSSRETKNIE